MSTGVREQKQPWRGPAGQAREVRVGLAGIKKNWVDEGVGQVVDLLSRYEFKPSTTKTKTN
jgi:hypothetical protein